MVWVRVVLDRRVFHDVSMADVSRVMREIAERGWELVGNHGATASYAQRFDHEETLRGELEALRSLSLTTLVTVVEPQR
jgi:hypothetical protein